MQGAGLQTGCRPSKDGNDAMSMYALSETDSDYIRQPRVELVKIAMYYRVEEALEESIRLSLERSKAEGLIE